MEYTIPEAILKFRQGIGRLIRTASDKGTVVLLDPRIVQKRYGRLFLDALPECKVEIVRT
jgi:ATP-dependent DNA helicase DinG